MQHWVNWDGVSKRDRAATLAMQLNLAKLPPELGEQIAEDAGLSLGELARHAPSPAEIVRSGKPHGGNDAGGKPPQPSPSEIAKGRGTAESVPAKTNDNDHGR